MSVPPPKITIVTPSFNQGQFIEETIRSVVTQNYPNFEYIVIDGGSKDGTVDILKRYGEHINYWTSEPDCGQADALNKGFARATGELFGWLNSDDTYERGVFAEAVELFERFPEVEVISGRCRLWYGDDRDQLLAPSPHRTLKDFLKIGSGWMNNRLIVQPESFFRRTAFEKVRKLRTDLPFCFDVCFWIEMARAGCRFHSVDRHWANLRMHGAQKTTDLQRGYAELVRAVWKYLIADWDRLGPEAREIGDDIFAALARVHEHDRQELEKIRQSTSYRLGRLVTRFKP